MTISDYQFQIRLEAARLSKIVSALSFSIRGKRHSNRSRISSLRQVLTQTKCTQSRPSNRLKFTSSFRQKRGSLMFNKNQEQQASRRNSKSRHQMLIEADQILGEISRKLLDRLSGNSGTMNYDSMKITGGQSELAPIIL